MNKTTKSHAENYGVESCIRTLFQRTRASLLGTATAAILTQHAMAVAPLWVPQSGTGATYYSNVHFVDANTGWFTAGTKVRKTTDGGTNWVEQNPSSSEGLTGIHFVDANTGWATGYYGTVRKTTNGGASWSAQTHPTGAHCWGVFALDPNLAWQAGSSGMLGRTTNGGTNWVGSEGNPAGNPGWGMYDIYFTDSSTGYAVAGGNYSSKTTNGGLTWTQMNTGTTAQLLKVKFANANVGWMVGAAGTIIKTTDAGVSWTAQASGTSAYLTGVSFVDANKGWVVGDAGTILRTDNGGTTWLPETSGTTEYLGDVHFVDAANGWVVGNNNTVLKYNGGPVITTLIDDRFDDGNIGTNTLGIGNGFVNTSQSPFVNESGGFLNLDVNDSFYTRVLSSNSANSVNPFQTAATALTYKFGTVGRDSNYQRLWIGYRVPVGSNHFYPNTGTQGLYLSVLSQNQSEDGWQNHGNLIAVSNTGAMTTLASWTWANPDQLSGLKVKLTTTATSYLIEFSEAAGAVPTFVTGSASGALSGMGTISGNFSAAIHNQYWFGNDGGGVKLDSVLLQTGVPFTPPPTNAAPTNIALSATIIDENNAPGATVGTLTATDSNAGDTHTFSLVTGTGDTDNVAFAITGNALTINAAADFETKNSYSIRIRATDSGAGNLTFDKQFTVSITDVTIPQVIDFGALAAKTFGDADFLVSAMGGASGQSVTFSVESGPATISGNLVSITGAGEVTIRASQAGFGDYSAATPVDQTFTVAKAAQSILFGALGGKTFGDAPFTVSATGGVSGNAVTFSASGPATVSGNEVTITGAGSVTITANQAGNANYEAAAPVDQTFAVAKAAQSITFSVRPRAATTATIVLAATGGAGSSPTTYSVVSGPGSIAGNTLTFTGPGDVVVRASRLGDDNYLDAASVDASIIVRVNAAPVALNDGVAMTTGTATLYPLANDTDADGDVMSIVAVSELSVVIDGRTLVVPVGYTGTFTYTVSDSFAESVASVEVTAETPVTTPRRFSGLLYNSDGKIVGRASMSRSSTGINILLARVGAVTGSSVFGGTSVTASPTGLGPINVSIDANNRVAVVLPSGVTGDLRPSVSSATGSVFHVGVVSLDSAIPGAGVGRITVTTLGTARIRVTMPDGRGFLAASDVRDNGSIVFFGHQNSSKPTAWIGGEFILSNLTKTDLTGELEWSKPAQTAGMHRTGLNTVMVANGCKATGAIGIPDGPVVVKISGGNFAAPVTVNSTILNGKVAAVLPSLTGWSAQLSVQSFRAGVKPTGVSRASLATGYFFPKSQTALGFFPGTTQGGKIELSVP